MAIRLPATVVEALELKEGDDIEITVAGKRDFKVERDGRRKKALDLLRKSNWKLPEGFKFDRGEAHER